MTGTSLDGSLEVATVTDDEGPAPAPGDEIPDAPGSGSGYRAEELWVDRAHQNAIANEACISGVGQGIVAGWYLNNKRVSKYNISGTGTPQWVFSCPEAGNTFDLAATFQGVFSACASAMQTRVWENSGSQPTQSFETALAQDVEEAGGTEVIVYVDTEYHLVCRRASTGWTVAWEVPLQTVGNGIYGVDISSSGNRVLVSAYDQTAGAQVYSMTDGTMVGTAMGNYGQTKAAISGDGNRVVIGNFNGQIRMFQWSGSAWTSAGVIATGDSWVTAVAISDDGHTVAGGTLGFSPYRGKLVAVNWPASGSPSAMWEYKNYGDEVSSVAICDDGSVIVAGSWGQYNGTYGDVFTALDHDGGVIFHLLDDIDEPGSIMSVDISDDGSFATASGKAVHARAMGNGGEVYGIQLMDAPAHDVGVVAVVSPVENQQVGAVVVPQVTVGNFGQSPESFPVNAEIYEAATQQVVWTGSANVSGLAAGGQTNVTFPSWTVPEYGSWVFSVETALPGDAYALNDSLGVMVRAYHDAQATGIVCPYAENTVWMPFTPVVEVKNSGTYTESIQVNLTIAEGSTVYYDQTVTSGAVAPGALTQVQLPSWTPTVFNECTATATVTVTDDYVPENDETDKECGFSFEYIYEDGEWDSFYWVGSQDDDMFATRFSPLVPPAYMATGFRVYVNSTEPFSWAMLCTDDGGLPDLADTLFYVEGISAPTAPGWLEVPMEVLIEEPGDLWFVTHWPDAKALGVGTDLDVPRTNRSWWHNTQSGWVNFTGGDWSFRLTLLPETGTPGAGPAEVFQLGVPSPNPTGGCSASRLRCLPPTSRSGWPCTILPAAACGCWQKGHRTRAGAHSRGTAPPGPARPPRGSTS